MRRPLNLWLLVVVTVCGISLLFGRGMLTVRGPAAGPAGMAETAPWPEAGERGIRVQVLNGTRVPGLARDVGLLLGRAGLAPVGFGNAPPQQYASTFVVNRRLEDGVARRLAELLGGVPVIREYDGRSLEDALIVLGADHAEVKRVLAETEK
ncbi:MAG: LytR C-terminal domain-containing protein [bacterium]